MHPAPSPLLSARHYTHRTRPLERTSVSQGTWLQTRSMPLASPHPAGPSSAAISILSPAHLDDLLPRLSSNPTFHPHGYGLNISVSACPTPKKNSHQNPDPKLKVSRLGTFGKELGHEDRASMNWIDTHIKEAPKGYPVPLSRENTVEG